MKVLFAHDCRFIKDENGNYYSEGTLSFTIWERYLKYFDNVVVAARQCEAKDINFNNMQLSSGPNVSFIGLPNISSVMSITKRHIVKNILNDYIYQVDALIARLPSEIGLLAIDIAKRARIPWAVEIVGCAFDSLWNYSLQGKLYAPLAMWRNKAEIRSAPFAIYVTGQFLQKRYPCNGFTVGCSDVEIPDVDYYVLHKRLEKIKTSNKPIKIGIIGTARYKGIDTILSALKKIKHEMPPFEFHIVGGGDLSRWRAITESEALTKETVFEGKLPGGSVIYDWLDGVDIYIQPSYVEGLPRALIEAMSRGCPAIGSTAGGIPELLNNSCIHLPGDSVQLSRLILKAAQDQQWQILQAEQNFAISRKYVRSALDPIREKFWEKFFLEVKRGKSHNFCLA